MDKLTELKAAQTALQLLLDAPVRDEAAVRIASRNLKKAMGYRFYEDPDDTVKRRKEEGDGFMSWAEQGR